MVGKSTHDVPEDTRNNNILIHVDGKLLPKDKAVVSVYDSGFMLGDGIWEGLRIHDGRIIFLEMHLDRLFEAALAIDLQVGKTKEQLRQIIFETLQANDMYTNAHVRLMVTRGRKSRPFQHPQLCIHGSTIVIIAEHSKPEALSNSRGIRLFSVPHHRGLPLTQDAKLNSHSKLNCIIALNHAIRAGADEALMLDPHGFVNTTNACNFFIVKNGNVWTSTGDYCMNGITRGKVVDICHSNGIDVNIRNFSLVDAYSADEAFLTGTFGAQTWVSEIDGRTIGNISLGPLLLRIRSLYKEMINGLDQQIIPSKQ